MRIADAEDQLRAAIRQRVEVAGPDYSDDTRATADGLIELAIGGLTLAALQVGRNRTALVVDGCGL